MNVVVRQTVKKFAPCIEFDEIERTKIDISASEVTNNTYLIQKKNHNYFLRKKSLNFSLIFFLKKNLFKCKEMWYNITEIPETVHFD